MNAFLISAFLACLALSLVAAQTEQTVRWCVRSAEEETKCLHLFTKAPSLKCVRKRNLDDCIKAIANREADAITLDGGEIYKAGLTPYNLHPIIAEDYGKDSGTCIYAVAVVKSESTVKFSELKQKKTCHTGFGKSAGWNIPIGTLVSKGLITGSEKEDRELVDVVNEYFSASCVPGLPIQHDCRKKNLTSLCKGDCSKSEKEPYHDYEGALKCLQDGTGDVAFVEHLTVSSLAAGEKKKYKLLCSDDSSKSVDEYKTCHLARVPAHAVVSRIDANLKDQIFNVLDSLQKEDLFSSQKYKAKNLMFKDSTQKLLKVPEDIDSFLYLGAEYLSIVHSLDRDRTPSTNTSDIRWCTVGLTDRNKCDNSFGSRGLLCLNEDCVDQCIVKIMRREADAMVVDGGHMYSAGKCGLVPAMAEESTNGYYAVAVVRANSGVNWKNLRQKKSCHTVLGGTAGWKIPMATLHNTSETCDFSQFFSESCVPGADPTSKLCKLCKGKNDRVDKHSKCKNNNEEIYYGYSGAFRCLVEGGGNVAFIKHTTLDDVIKVSRPDWAHNLNVADFRLICPAHPEGVEISEFQKCNLAKVPPRAVITHPDSRKQVVNFFKNQPDTLFQSDSPIKKLVELSKNEGYKDFLGPDYLKVIDTLRKCPNSLSELEKACTFHTCQQKE